MDAWRQVRRLLQEHGQETVMAGWRCAGGSRELAD